MNAFVRSQLEAAAALEGAAPPWLAALRREAREAFARAGLPGPRDEPWKYTALRALSSRTPRVGDPDAASRAVDSAAIALPGLDGPRLVFVNGGFRRDLSRLEALPEGVRLGPLADAIRADDQLAHAAYGASFDEAGAGLARLNTAMAGDGAFLQVADGIVVDVPIHLVFVGAEAGGDVAWHLRNLLCIGERAEISIVEQYVDAGGALQFGNLVERVIVGRAARLSHVRLQEAADDATLIARSDVTLAAGARYEGVALELGAGLARRDVRVRLEGREARVDLRGATALRGRQHMDAHFEVRHVAPGATSDVRWRGIADQRARAVFGGALVVEPGADGSDASLSNRNLLLSPHAEIDTRPVLEIHADEVKAAHGATVGRLDEQSLFYLRSRGIDLALARSMLTYAFCSDVFDGVGFEPLRAALGERFARHLPSLPGGDRG
jgi:Fe-S cluster assembly protein SufD